jgi:hypothetical protein
MTKLILAFLSCFTKAPEREENRKEREAKGGKKYDKKKRRK